MQAYRHDRIDAIPNWRAATSVWDHLVIETMAEKAYRFRKSAKHLRAVAGDLGEDYRRDFLLSIADDYECMADNILR